MVEVTIIRPNHLQPILCISSREFAKRIMSEVSSDVSFAFWIPNKYSMKTMLRLSRYGENDHGD